MEQLLSPEMKSVTWVQILGEAVCISLRTDALEKCMNPSVLRPAMGK